MKQYTLLELCSCIDEALSMELNDTYWVRAEIASLTERGHCYMELVEKAKNNAIAQAPQTDLSFRNAQVSWYETTLPSFLGSAAPPPPPPPRRWGVEGRRGDGHGGGH